MEKNALFYIDSASDPEDFIKSAFNHGIDINFTESQGLNSLFYCRSEKSTSALIKAGINVQQLSTSNESAIFWNHSFRVLTKAGLNINHQDQDGNTVLFHLIRKNASNSIVMEAIECGADLYIENKSTWCPFFSTIFQKDERLFDLLLKNGANITHRDSLGQTALHVAAQFTDAVNIFKKIHNLGLDLLAKDNEGATPLHVACGHNSRETVKYILSNFPKEKRVDLINMKMTNQDTPYLLACKGKHKKLINTLIDQK